MRVTELKRRHTGSTIRWLPDLEVFTDIDIPADYYRRCCGGRPWSTPESPSACGAR